jgi:hypothetical protein
VIKTTTTTVPELGMEIVKTIKIGKEMDALDMEINN